MRLTILGDPAGWHVNQLLRAAARLAVNARAVPFGQLTGTVGGAGGPSLHLGGHDLFADDAVLVRGIPPGTLEQVVVRMDALHRLEAAGVRVVNPPRAVETCIDKYLATAKLAAAGLAVPETAVCEGADEATAAFAALGGDAVCKPIFGAEGRGVVRLSDPETAGRVFRALSAVGSVIYLQRFVPHRFDARALVAGGRVVAAMRRLPRPDGGDFRTNVACGGTAAAFDLPHSWATAALAAAAACGATVAGVDLLPDPAAADLEDAPPLVTEVNACPGFAALQRVTGADVAAAVVRAAAGLPAG